MELKHEESGKDSVFENDGLLSFPHMTSRPDDTRSSTTASLSTQHSTDWRVYTRISRRPAVQGQRWYFCGDRVSCNLRPLYWVSRPTTTYASFMSSASQSYIDKKTLTENYGRIYPAVGRKSAIQYDPHCIWLGNDDKSSYKYISHIRFCGISEQL